MNTYAIRREHAWQSPEQVERVAAARIAVGLLTLADVLRRLRGSELAELTARRM